MHVISDTTDPFYTSLGAGAYTPNKPGGHPCDRVYSCSPSLSTGVKIVIAVVVTVMGLVVFGGIFYVLYIRRRRRATKDPKF